MKVIVRDAAAAELDAAVAWISRDSPRAASKLKKQIVERINHLAIPGLSSIGRRGQISGTRELIVPPYIIVYEVDGTAGEVIVLAIMHAARD